MDIREFGGDIVRAVAFLSRIPVSARFFEGRDGSMRRLAGAFPAAGLVIAVPAALLLFVTLSFGADPLLAAFLGLTLQTLVTGALHEDGLADSADGLGGGRNRDHALDIMKDSRIGAYGVIALVLSFGLRAAAVAALARLEEPLTVALVWIATAGLSRAAMVWHWHRLPSARTAGVAASAGVPDDGARTTALITGIASFVLLTLTLHSTGAILFGLLVAVLLTLVFTRHACSRIGGHTGDTIGATQQIAEIGVLCALALAG
ncbi:adenosylcobinamide-GDP ribazoletransferase [Rhizobium sp. LjRoot30]|uniref:adenosylcobinamide-GDP ribazoletransferase n=1 Tax=Rhizobium sp. LjRoot30 TaxID=3342320 RepID=UPI003ECD1088